MTLHNIFIKNYVFRKKKCFPVYIVIGADKNKKEKKRICISLLQIINIFSMIVNPIKVSVKLNDKLVENL